MRLKQMVCEKDEEKERDDRKQGCNGPGEREINGIRKLITSIGVSLL